MVERSILGTGCGGGGAGVKEEVGDERRGPRGLCEMADWELKPGQAQPVRGVCLPTLFSLNQEISA